MRRNLRAFFVPFAVLSGMAIGACSAAGSLSETEGAQGGTASTTGSGGSWNIDGGTGSGSSQDGDTCGSVEVPSTVEVIPGNVLVIFDRSDSMAGDFATPNGNKPKYVAAGEALVNAVTPIQDKLNIGAILFPTTSTIVLCSALVDPITAPTQINFLPGAAFVPAWIQWWMTNMLILGTPLNRAFDRGDEALQQPSLTGETVVVVFTDGEPVCMDGMPAPDRAAQWLAQGIKTYVIGLPGASSATLLNDIAVKGGTGGFLLPTDSAQLEQQLAQIATTVTTKINSCTITLNPPPPNTADVHLIVTDAASQQQFEVPPDDGAGNGWTLSPDGTIATLTGTICDSAKNGKFSNVHFEFGCVEFPPLPK